MLKLCGRSGRRIVLNRPTTGAAAIATASLVALVGCADVLGGLAPGGGNRNPNQAPGTSDEVGAMQAIGQLVVTDDAVVAQLNVLTTAGSGVRALSGVAGPYVDVASVRRSLPTTDFVGVFEYTATLPSAVAPEPGNLVTFGYEITDSAGEVTVIEVATAAPSSAPIATFPQTQIYFTQEPLELELSGWADGGWIQVANDAGALTYSTIDSSLEATPAMLASLRAVQAPRHTVPGTAFAEPGVYTVVIATFALSDDASVAQQLGDWSWFGVGRTSRYLVEIEL